MGDRIHTQQTAVPFHWNKMKSREHDASEREERETMRARRKPTAND